MNDFRDYEYIEHYGVKGMHWGIRRYQNKDGSLTPVGKRKYEDAPVDDKSRKKAARQASKDLNKLDKIRAAKTRYKALTEEEYSKLENRKKTDRLQKKMEQFKEGSKRYESQLKEVNKKTNDILKTLERNGFNVSRKETAYAIDTPEERTARFMAQFLGGIIASSIISANQVATNHGNADLNHIQKGTRYKVR